MEPLVIAICTRARPTSLRRLLDCLAEQSWPAGVSVLVVDNDRVHSARMVVDAVAQTFPVALDYVTQERPGYATVRNAALDRVVAGTAICFIDDDALVPPGWVEAMRGEQVRHPDAVVRSRYLHVPQSPSSSQALTTLVERTRIVDLRPAGTSGLLLPAKATRDFRFDSYFDHSGAEDMDLLARLQTHGFHEVLADAVVIEDDRVQVLAQEQQRQLARWNGRLATIAMARRGSGTLGFRASALAQSVWASAQAALRRLLGRRAAAQAYGNLAASRWAMATAPLKPPKTLGSRPVV